MWKDDPEINAAMWFDAGELLQQSGYLDSMQEYGDGALLLQMDRFKIYREVCLAWLHVNQTHMDCVI